MRSRYLARLIAVSLVLIASVGLNSAALAREKWGPFLGQVVDLETGQPIAGAVALAVWWRIIPTPVQGTEEFYDAREAVTGPDGRFEIPRLSAEGLTFGVQPAQITIFAPGHVWQATQVTPPGGEEFVDPTVVQMHRLKTLEERRKYVRRLLPAGIPHEKMRQFIKALNVERSALGMGTYSTGEEK